MIQYPCVGGLPCGGIGWAPGCGIGIGAAPTGMVGSGICGSGAPIPGGGICGVGVSGIWPGGNAICGGCGGGGICGSIGCGGGLAIFIIAAATLLRPLLAAGSR
jgi:hypothetical protein